MRRVTTFVLGLAIVLGASAERPAAQVAPQGHASQELLALAKEFRDFRSPVFRARTWRPNRVEKGVPDYAALSRAQLDGVRKFQQRLAAIDPKAWPVHDRVDYLLLRAEMDDVEFEHRVLREAFTNPAFYIEQALGTIARTVRFQVVPYTPERAEAVLQAFEQVNQILDQAQKNVALPEANPELSRIGLRRLQEIRRDFAAGARLFEPHFPESQRSRLAAVTEKAAGQLASYAGWVEASLPQMKARGGVGRENLEWFLKRVNLVPWSVDEMLFLGEIEKNRFLMSIEIEEKKNQGLKALTMPTTDEWIEWFRLTYLQTKYWLKDMDVISFPPYVGESYLEKGTWLEPFGEIGNRTGIMGFPKEAPKENTKRLFVVPEDHWFANTYWDRIMRLDPITDYQHSDWPGHYFEGEVTKRNACPVRAGHLDTGFSQGWAHYFEEFFLDMGYPYLRGPRTRELTYNFLLLRAVRVPLDLKLAMNELTIQEAMQYQIDRVPGMEEQVSREEVNMYARWPYQATSYIVGKKQIEQILAERIAKDKFSVDWRKFHDTMLAGGQIPLSLVRWEMTGNDDQIKKLW